MSWCDEPPPPLLLEGIAQFNRGEYFEQHETLEILWRAEIVRYAALSGHTPDRRRVSSSAAWQLPRRVYMLTRGSMYLGPFAPRCQGVDIEALLDAAARALSTVEELGPGRLDEFDWALAPRITLVERRMGAS